MKIVFAAGQITAFSISGKRIKKKIDNYKSGVSRGWLLPLALPPVHFIRNKTVPAHDDWQKKKKAVAEKHRWKANGLPE